MMTLQTPKPIILVVEDEASIREMLRFVLEAEGFHVVLAEDIKAAETAIADAMPQLVLLDWMLPGMSGVEFARRLKKHPTTQSLPIILLTAKAEEANIVKGFESGVDDYIVKPFSPKELAARIRAVLRRGIVKTVDDVIHMGDLRVEGHQKMVFYQNEPINLSALEYRFLEFFVTHPNRAYSREELIALVWRGSKDISDRTVDVHIRRLRKALSHTGIDQCIKTVHGTGYQFSYPEIISHD